MPARRSPQAVAVARAYISIGRVLRTAGRLTESVRQFHLALDIAGSRYAADPSNRDAAGRLASIYAALAPAYADAAAASTNRTDAMRLWQDARSAARKSVDIIGSRDAPGPLAPVGESELTTLAALAATADRELARLGARTAR